MASNTTHLVLPYGGRSLTQIGVEFASMRALETATVYFGTFLVLG